MRRGELRRNGVGTGEGGVCEQSAGGELGNGLDADRSQMLSWKCSTATTSIRPVRSRLKI